MYFFTQYIKAKTKSCFLQLFRKEKEKSLLFLFCSPLQFSFLGQIYKNRSTKRQKRSASQKVSKSSDFDHQQHQAALNKIEYKRQESNGSESQETNSKLTLLSTQVILEN